MRWAVGCVLVGACLSHGCGSGLHDTGFTGTWERPLAGGHSSLSIREEAAGYVVRWSKLDGAESVRCDDRGHCEEFVGETKVYEWRFQPFLKPDSDDLFLEVVGTPLEENAPGLRYVDRLTLHDGGLALSSSQISQNGIDLDVPIGPRVFQKVADEPR